MSLGHQIIINIIQALYEEDLKKKVKSKMGSMFQKNIY